MTWSARCMCCLLSIALAAPAAVAEPEPVATASTATPVQGLTTLDSSSGDAEAPTTESRYELRVNRLVTGTAVAMGAAYWVGSSKLFQDTLAPDGCRIFCEDRVNPFDRIFSELLLWDDDRIPQILSDASAYVIIPAVGIGGLTLSGYQQGSADWKSNWVDDLLVVAEVAVAVGVLNRTTVLTLGRTRPRTANAEPGDPELLAGDAHQSFFSGHTSAAFAVGISSAMVARLRGYKLEPYLWASALVFGSAVGYLRIAGADHYPTDVLVGAAVATGAGLLIPWLHREPLHPGQVAFGARSVDGGGLLTLSGRW